MIHVYLPHILAGLLVVLSSWISYRRGCRAGYAAAYRLRYHWATLSPTRASKAEMSALLRGVTPGCVRHGPELMLNERCTCRHAVINRHPSGRGK